MHADSKAGPSGRMRRIAFLAALLLAAASCRESGREGEFYEVSGRLVVFNYRIAKATFVVTLKPLKPMVEGDVAVALFQNPRGGEEIEVRQKIWPNLGKVALETPPLHCIRKGGTYRAEIRILTADGAVRQTLETRLTSTLDQSILPERPLVVGPFYDPNPEPVGQSAKERSGAGDDCPAHP
jgi:hypothetical protein